MNKSFLTLVLLFSTISIYAQDHVVCHEFDVNGQTREHTVDFESMVLDIHFDTKIGQVEGSVVYHFTPLRKRLNQLVLDAPNMEIQEVILDGNACKYFTNETELTISFLELLQWEKEYTLEIKYKTIPEKGLYFLGWNDPTNRARKQIWTQGQGIDNRYWLPCFDDVSDKLITETYITFENGYEVISNGNFISKKAIGENSTTWHYKMEKPHVIYLLMIAIGEFDYKDITSGNGVVSRQYYYPDQPEKFEPTYQYSKEMMDWMEEEFGVEYAWGKIYRNVPVADFLYGAMENTTSTIFTDTYLQDEREALERNYIGTNAHELTHQWFGDLITEWNGESHWLHESFATHYAKHFKREVLGEDDFQWERYLEMQRSFYADGKDDLPIAHSKAGSARHYPKGSIVIDMLRDAAGGDEQYKKVIHNYLNKYAFKHVDSHLFELAFTETLGLNLNWFFDQWIYKGGFPSYDVSYSDLKDKTVLHVKQVQEQTSTIGLFRVDMDIYVAYKDGTGANFTERIEAEVEKINLPNLNNKEVAYVIFDKGNKIYKKVNFERETTSLLAQAKGAENMIDRYLALKELEAVPIEDKRDVLLEIYKQETFFATKANIAKQLANDSKKKSQKLILLALEDELPEVRRACVYHVDDITPEMLPKFENLLKDPSFVTIEKALGKLITAFPENTEKYLEISKADAAQNALLEITWLNHATENGDAAALKKLVDYSSASFEFRTRIKAIQMLESQAYKEEDFLRNLIEASTNFNRRLAGEAKSTISILVSSDAEKRAFKALVDATSFDINQQKRMDSVIEKLEE